ncbi:MAG: UTP--glucose-1-phosphate uridylyltransferase [Actinomycetales bacterium]|nr:UTP--glucose-1-phosphate uridylyltransferase [Actinomycetales bacterium]
MRSTTTGCRRALPHVAIVKLNGGLGTTMGLDGPKSVLLVRDGLSFLDIIVRQVRSLRARYAVSLPLAFMNSFRTRGDTLRALAAYPDLSVEGLSLDFVQGAVPKVASGHPGAGRLADGPGARVVPARPWRRVRLPRRQALCSNCGTQGVRYVFISNADNLGATCDPAIASWVIEHDLPLVVEACRRTANDRKGGHFARRVEDGRLILRELAMVAPGEEGAFGDIARHRFFNANSLWVRVDVVAELASASGPALPVIVNRKTVDPTDPTSTPVLQLESAMGAAIESVDGAQALLVARDRFEPVKTTADLLLLAVRPLPP